MKTVITANINGDEIEYSCTARQTLLEVLRGELYMTGTKNGCGSDCGVAQLF